MLTVLFPGVSGAFSLDTRLEDPQLEQRAQNLFNEIRCIVCVSQPISESDTDLARDLRNLIRKRIIKGETDEQIKSYLVSRYGEQILLSPPLTKNTVLLWVAPIIFILIGAALLMFLLSSKTKR